MRIIQSIWTANDSNLLKSNMGWLAPEYNLMSWALSCLQLRMFYPELVLYCDNTAKNMLVDVLQLPYNEVICNLDVLNGYPKELWALSKIKAYSLQEKLFLHVDGDVFVWEKFDDTLLQSGLIAQNEDEISSFEKTMKSLTTTFTYFPKEIIENRETGKAVRTYNAGIFGGSDISFFKEYTTKSLAFIHKNTPCFEKINLVDFNVIFEQYLFHSLAKSKNKKVTVLFSKIYKDNEYKGFGDFDKVSFEKNYIHLMSDYKKSDVVCKQLADKLRQDYPEYYYRIIRLFKENNISLHKNHSFFDTYLPKDFILNDSRLKHEFLNNSLEKKLVNSKKKTSKKITVLDIIDQNSIDTFDKKQLKDVMVFCEKINEIIAKKFCLISDDYLYGRDLNKTSYFKTLFGDKENIYDKRIVADAVCETVKSNYDWSYYFERNYDVRLNVNPLPNKEINTIYNLIIPECDDIGFAISTLDNLDLVILKILKKVRTVSMLFNELKPYFDEDDFNESTVEFELLILKKIKKAIHNKSVRVLF